MPGPRQLVDPPLFVPRPYGLWSVVQDRSVQLAADDMHWRNGVTFEPLCGVAGVTYDDYCLETSPDAKADNVGTPVRGALPFTPFAEIDCAPVGYTQEQHRQRAIDALTNAEQYQVEQVFWTGTAGGDANIVYPHLAASAAVTSGSTPIITLQCAAVTVTGSAVLDVTEGIGMLEGALGACSNGQGVLHVPLTLGEMLFRANAVKADGNQLKTQAGNLVALGAGYPGTGPDGTQPLPGSLWIYMTGQVFGYRSAIEAFNFRDSFDRTENTVKLIAERTYVLGFDCCCLYAVQVSTGGIITGQPLSPV